MATVALIVHEYRADAEQHARQLGRWLRGEGHDLALLESNADEFDLSECDPSVRAPDDLADGATVVVSLGGDGSMLRAAQLAALHDVPVLGVNFGQLGYLTEVEPDGMLAAVQKVLAGDAPVEERMRVSSSVLRTDGSVEHCGDALNEALVERDESGRTVRLGLSLDGNFFTTYNADGVIIASPTGSTAYSLSARGPIVAPLNQALIVTPVSPHQLFDRSLVIGPTSQVEIEVLADRAAQLSVDGRAAARLSPGDRVVCTASERPARFVAFNGADFLQVLKTKFGLSDR